MSGKEGGGGNPWRGRGGGGGGQNRGGGRGVGHGQQQGGGQGGRGGGGGGRGGGHQGGGGSGRGGGGGQQQQRGGGGDYYQRGDSRGSAGQGSSHGGGGGGGYPQRSDSRAGQDASQSGGGGRDSYQHQRSDGGSRQHQGSSHSGTGGGGYHQRSDSRGQGGSGQGPSQSGGGGREGYHQRSDSRGDGGSRQQGSSHSGGGGGGRYQEHGGGSRGRGGDRGRGGRGGDRGGRGGRGFARKRISDPPPKVWYEDLSKCPDPYELPVDPKWRQISVGWKPFPENKDDVVLHKKPLGDKPSWCKRRIDVSVNHYLIESLLKPGTFPFPTVYHYDISYDIDRKRKDDKAKPQPGPSSKPQEPAPEASEGKSGGGKKKGKGKRKQSEGEVDTMTKQMKQSGLSSGGGGGDPPVASGSGGPPPAKKLPKHLTNAILDYLIPKIRTDYRHQAIATDGSFNLYSSRRLEQVGIPMQHDVTFQNLRDKNLTEDQDNATIKVMIQPTIDKSTGQIHTIDTASIANWFQTHRGSLEGIVFSPELRQTLEAACNAFVKCMPNFRYFSVGRNTMVPQQNAETTELGGGLQAWKGISANIAMGWKPYLNVDIANCAFILDRNVLDVLAEVVGNCEDITRWNNREYDDARGLLRTCKVSYTVDSQKRSGPIRDIPRRLTPRTHKFQWEERKKPDKTVSIFEYYKERYNKTLECPNGPLLEIRKKGTYVPAELCTIKKGQSYNRKLDGNQTTAMIDFARKEPDETKMAVESRMKEMKLQKNEVLQGLGIKVADTMLKVNARVLVPPTIRYGEKAGQPNQIAHVSPTDGTWDCWRQGNFNFYKTPTPVKHWGILVVGCPRFRGSNDQALVDFAKCLRVNGAKKGVIFSQDARPIIVDREDRRHFSPVENSKDFEKYFKMDFKGCDIVICIFPKKGDPLYGAIKHAAEVGVGILTQCVAERNVGFVKDATIQNILFKMNQKLGGINHVTVAPFDPKMAKQFCTLLMDCPVMVLGADVTHAPPGSRKTLENGEEWIMPSYAAVTGSLDRTCMPFMTEVRAQRKANAGAAEVIQNFADIVEKMLRCFIDTAKKHPLKIIYFRDGVGEGQFPEVLHVEMNAIREACKRVVPNGSYQPKITFITVQKRHKTRFFWHYGKDQIEDAPAGTVIDQEIVHPSEIDFYLLSHKGLLGTSRPSRYHVLWDDSDLTQDQLQSLAYTLCYMYARCTKSVKMPAPTYYAHLAADRAKKLCEGFETRHGPPSEENLNEMLKRNVEFVQRFPMHFI